MIYIIVNQLSLHMKRMMVLYVLELTIFSVHRQSPSLLLIFIHFSLVLTYLIICHCFSSFTLIFLHSLPYLLLHRPKPMYIDWSEITSSHIVNYQDMLCDRLSDPPADHLSCSLPNCSAHASLLDDSSEHNYYVHYVTLCFLLYSL